MKNGGFEVQLEPAAGNRNGTGGRFLLLKDLERLSTIKSSKTHSRKPVYFVRCKIRVPTSQLLGD